MGNVENVSLIGKVPNAGVVESREYHEPNNPRLNAELFTQRIARKKAFVRWLMCFIIGGTIALIYRGVAYVIDTFGDAHYELLESMVEEKNLAGAFFANTAIMLSLVLTAVSLVIWEPASGGSGIPDVIGFLNGVAAERLMDWTTFLAKLIGVTCAVSSGLFVGPEGPTIHIGALLGAFLLRSLVAICKKFNIFLSLQRLRNDKDERDFVANGAAGGIAAAFHAPIGGVIFAIEEAISFFNAKLIARTYLTCATAYYVLYFLETHSYQFDTNLFTEFQLDLSCRISYYAEDIFWFALLGALGGLLGGFFNFLVIKLTTFRLKYINPLGWRRISEAVIITLLTSIFVVFIPYNYPCTKASQLVDHVTRLNNESSPHYDPSEETCINDVLWATVQSYPGVFLPNSTGPVPEPVTKFLGDKMLLRRAHCPPGQYNEMASLLYVSGHQAVANLFKQGTYYYLSPWTILAYLTVYFFTAAATAGISIASGLVVPTLTIGGCLGRIFSIALNRAVKDHLGEHGADPGTWAMIGAAAFWSGSGRITVTIAIIMLEITGKFRFLPAIMIAVVVAKWVGDWLNHSLYHALLHVKHIPYLPDPHKSMTTTARDAMVADVVTLKESDSAAEVESVLETTHNGFPVLRTDDTGRTYMVGLVTRTYLQRAVKENINQALIPVGDYMDCTPYTVLPNYPIVHAFVLFKNLGLRHLCVVNDKFELQGILTRKDLERAAHDHEHKQKLQKLQKSRSGDDDDDSARIRIEMSAKLKDPLNTKSVTESLSAPLLDDDDPTKN